MTGVIVSTPPVVEAPPGTTTGNPVSLPPVTYQFAVTNQAQTWTGLQTFVNGSMEFAGSTSGFTLLNASAVASGILTLPSATDTLVGRATPDTLGNKSFGGLTKFIGTDAAGGGVRYYRANGSDYTEIFLSAGGLGFLQDPLNFYSGFLGTVVASIGRDGSFQTIADVIATTFNLRGHISGLTLSAAGGTATFGIAAGVAVDSTNAAAMVLASAYTKTTAAWAVGSGNGALDTGSIANGTWYHVYEIKRPDTRVVDLLISLSATSPTLPANYTLFRRIGAMKTNGSSQWIKFIQNGDEFLWDTAVSDAAALAVTTSVSSITLTVPAGISVVASFQGDYSNTAAGHVCLLYSPLQSTQAAGTPAGNWSLFNPTASGFSSSAFAIRTNTSGQINAVSDTSSGNSLYAITRGWIDRRGRDD